MGSMQAAGGGGLPRFYSVSRNMACPARGLTPRRC